MAIAMPKNLAISLEGSRYEHTESSAASSIPLRPVNPVAKYNCQPVEANPFQIEYITKLMMENRANSVSGQSKIWNQSGYSHSVPAKSHIVTFFNNGIPTKLASMTNDWSTSRKCPY